MRVQVFDQIDSPLLRLEWERLEKEASIFAQSTYHWCATWWKNFGGRRKLHVVMVLDERGITTGIAPLCLEQNPCGQVLRSFPVNFGDFFEIAVFPGQDDQLVFQALLDHIREYHGWNAALLTPVNDSSKLFEFLKGQHIANKVLAGNIVTDISGGSWEDYQKMLTRNRRMLTRKKMRQLEKEHQVVFELVRDKAGYLEYFDVIRDLQKRRATKDRSDRSDRYMACVRETYSYFYAKGEMILYLLKADENVIAYRIGIITDKTYYDWNTNYDIAWSEFSPGSISVGYAIRDLIERGFTTVNFMAGVYDYKLSYSPNHELRRNHLFLIDRGSVRSALFRKYHLNWRDRIRPYYKKSIQLKSNTLRYLSRQHGGP